MRAALGNITKAISPARIARRRSDKKIIQEFADQAGLIYFGYVSQLEDDHKIIRGMTLSTKHHDTHYCIGTYDDYDVSFVERSDVLQPSTKHAKKHHRWHILEFDLKTSRHLPHVFVGRHTHSETVYMQLFTKFPALRSIRLGALGQHTGEFLNTYRVYARPTNALEVEELLTPLATEMVSKHFGSLAIEISRQSLYVYSEHKHLSAQLLMTMAKNGAWLAHHIDEQAAHAGQPVAT